VSVETKVKVCGVIDPGNAVLAVEAGADFLGLNFHPPSPRFVEVGRAREIAAAVAGRVPLVGVFVNAAPGVVDEPPEAVAPFAGRAIKVFRSGGDPGGEALAPWREVWGWLFDAPHGKLYGGTGAPWAYDSVARLARSGAGPGRLLLAGGLGPNNVRAAVEACRPYAVDVCSRVESAPGIKDPELLRRLFEEVRNAQATTRP
jgi:phosphoribosylanthranilate isomerase